MAAAGIQLKDVCDAGCECSPIVTEGISSGPSTEIGSNNSDSDSDFSDDEDDQLIQFSVDETMSIFDYDDTILATTWLREQGLHLEDESMPTLLQQEKLNALALQAAYTLQEAKRFGKVVLITNAGCEWIELSCKKFMPSLYPLIKDIPKVSARASYEQYGVVSPFEWKFLAFQNEIHRCYETFSSQRQKNVISFGDSAYEREALIRVTEQLAMCHTKCLKFAERPDIDQLLKQHELINGCFKEIVMTDCSFDLCIKC